MELILKVILGKIYYAVLFYLAQDIFYLRSLFSSIYNLLAFQEIHFFNFCKELYSEGTS